MSEWDYKSMGFDSLEEMQASIDRVNKARKEPVSDLQQRAINYARTKTQLQENNGPDFKALDDGARMDQLDREVSRRIYWEEEQARKEKKTEEINNLLIKAGESSTAEKKAAAEARIKEDQEKAASEIRARHLKEQGLKGEEEIKKDESWKSMLKGLKGR